MFSSSCRQAIRPLVLGFSEDNAEVSSDSQVNRLVIFSVWLLPSVFSSIGLLIRPLLLRAGCIFFLSLYVLNRLFVFSSIGLLIRPLLLRRGCVVSLVFCLE